MIEMTIYRRELSIPQDDVNMVHAFLQDIWEENPYVAIRDRHSVETAIIELAANVILYAVSASEITCEIVVEIDTERIEATISDNGDLADLVIDEHIMPDEFSESGRGIPLIRALVDELEYDNSNGKNTWRISKKVQP